MTPIASILFAIYLYLLHVGGRGLERYSFSTGFPFSRFKKSLKKGRTFSSPPREASSCFAPAQNSRTHFVGGRGVFPPTGAVHLSHSEDGIGSRSSSPFSQAKQFACSAHIRKSRQKGGFSKCGRERSLSPYWGSTPFAFRRRNRLKVFKSSLVGKVVCLLRPHKKITPRWRIFKMWAGEDLNLHGLLHWFLKPARIPFRHPPRCTL